MKLNLVRILLVLIASSALGTIRNFKIQSQFFRGQTFWTSTNFVVMEGDDVEIELVNHLTSQEMNYPLHFEIEKVLPEVELRSGEERKIFFKAVKPGIYKIRNKSNLEGRFVILEK